MVFVLRMIPAFCLLSLLLPAARGQAGVTWQARTQRFSNGFQVHLERVEGCRELGLFLFVRGGWAEDPDGGSGAMQLLGRLVLAGSTPEREGFGPEQWRRERRAAGSLTRCRHTLYYSIGTRKAISADARRWAEVLDGKLRFGLRALGQARDAALRDCRNETTLYPGTMLRWRARQLLLAGGPAGRVGIGDHGELARVSDETLRKLYRETHRVDRAVLVAIGHVDPEKDLPFYRELFLKLGSADPADPADARAAPAAARPPEAFEAVPQVGAPFVSLAFPGPDVGSEGYAAFSLAALVLERRARIDFPKQKTLGLAQFPPGYFEPISLPRLAFLNRRGEDGVASADEVREELRGWAQRQCDRAPDERELELAKRRLRRILWPHPLRSEEAALLARFPQQLYGPGIARGAELLGELPKGLWSKAAGATEAQVFGALRARFRPEAGTFLGLLPKARPEGQAEDSGGGR